MKKLVTVELCLPNGKCRLGDKWFDDGMTKAGFQLLSDRASSVDDWSHKFYWTRPADSQEALEEKSDKLWTLETIQ
jgi:hypothetical protein